MEFLHERANHFSIRHLLVTGRPPAFSDHSAQHEAYRRAIESPQEDIPLVDQEGLLHFEMRRWANAVSLEIVISCISQDFYLTACLLEHRKSKADWKYETACVTDTRMSTQRGRVHETQPTEWKKPKV